MKKTFRCLALISILLLLPFFFSYCAPDKKSERDLGAMYHEMGKDKIYEIQEVAILLGLKHDLNTNEVELILYDFYKIYDNQDYQLITTHKFDLVQWKDSRKSEPPPLYHFIKTTAKCFSVAEKIVAGIILDYRVLKYRDELSSLDSSIEDLRYDLENSN